VGDVYSARTGHVVISFDGRFYVFGGTDGTARQADVHYFDLRTGQWSRVAVNGPMPPARSGAQAVVTEDGIVRH